MALLLALTDDLFCNLMLFLEADDIAGLERVSRQFRQRLITHLPENLSGIPVKSRLWFVLWQRLTEDSGAHFDPAIDWKEQFCSRLAIENCEWPTVSTIQTAESISDLGSMHPETKVIAVASYAFQTGPFVFARHSHDFYLLSVYKFGNPSVTKLRIPTNLWFRWHQRSKWVIFDSDDNDQVLLFHPEDLWNCGQGFPEPRHVIQPPTEWYYVRSAACIATRLLFIGRETEYSSVQHAMMWVLPSLNAVDSSQEETTVPHQVWSSQIPLGDVREEQVKGVAMTDRACLIQTRHWRHRDVHIALDNETGETLWSRSMPYSRLSPQGDDEFTGSSSMFCITHTDTHFDVPFRRQWIDLFDDLSGERVGRRFDLIPANPELLASAGNASLSTDEAAFEFTNDFSRIWVGDVYTRTFVGFEPEDEEKEGSWIVCRPKRWSPAKAIFVEFPID